MSVQEAKRRRAGVATAALSKPFRSPFKGVAGKTDINPQNQPGNRTGIQHNYTASQQIDSVISIAGRRPLRYERHDDADLSTRSVATFSSQLEITSLLNAQRQLKKKQHSLKEELHLIEQAYKIENKTVNSGSDGREVDGELLRLTRSWKFASRQAAEELFGSAKDRINRMGGPRAWKGMQQNQLDFQSSFSNENLQQNSAADDDCTEMRDSYTESSVEQETQNERDARDESNICEDWNENEFTMSTMLLALKIDLAAIGYSKQHQMWIDGY